MTPAPHDDAVTLQRALEDFWRARDLMRDALYRARYADDGERFADLIAGVLSAAERVLPQIQTVAAQAMDSWYQQRFAKPKCATGIRRKPRARHRKRPRFCVIPGGADRQIEQLIKRADDAAHEPPGDDAEWSDLYGMEASHD